MGYYTNTMDTESSTRWNQKMIFNMNQCLCHRINDSTLQLTGELKTRLDRPVDHWTEEVPS